MRIKREIDIMRLLGQNGAVRISELSRAIGVSQNTIRRDLKSLAEQGALKLTHGGAVLNDNIPMGVPLGEREVHFIEEKRRIGQRAIDLIPDGSAVLLDAGTTTEQIAQAIRNRHGLTVITNAMNIILRLSDAKDVVSVSTGGVLNTITKCFSGFHAEQFLSQFHADIAFISAGGVTDRGLTNTNAVEVQIKKTMIEISDLVVVAVTHDKIGKVSLSPFADLDVVDIVLTDDGADPKVIDSIERKGPKVIFC